jgi:hypothetical protein
MTRAGSGQTGAAVNFWLSSQDPKKAETARLPKKTKPYAFGYRSSERREQDDIPADHVLVDRQALAKLRSQHAKTLHIPAPCTS